MVVFFQKTCLVESNNQEIIRQIQNMDTPQDKQPGLFENIMTNKLRATSSG